MDRMAEIEYPLHDLLSRRWSPLAFADRPVPDEALGSLLEAARWSASCYNEQPWSFLVAARHDSSAFERLAGCLVEANRVWAAHAPVLILAVAKLRFDRDGSENRHAWYDLGQAAASLTVQATSLGLHVHQMAGFDSDQARKRCGIPETHMPVAMLAVGYYGNHEDLPPELRQRERTPRQRRDLRKLAFTAEWGVPAAFLGR